MVTDALLTNKKQRGKKSNVSANEILNPESTSIKSSLEKIITSTIFPTYRRQIYEQF